MLHSGTYRDEVRPCMRSRSCSERTEDRYNFHSDSQYRQRNSCQPITRSLTKFAKGDQCKYYDRFPRPIHFDHTYAYQNNVRPQPNEYCGYSYNNNSDYNSRCQKCGKSIRHDYHEHMQYSPTHQPASDFYAQNNRNLPCGNFNTTPVLSSFPKQEQHMNQASGMCN